MRRVDRSKIITPEILTSDKGAGAKETKKALEFYKKLKEAATRASSKSLAGGGTSGGKKRKNKKEKTFKFKIYGERVVRDAIGQLFDHKCAYCESRYAATQPVDVEHWRPKGMIATEEGTEITPGYYWLAADWNNLLPSCIDCNRRREQELQPGGEKRVVGKGNRFPLAKGCVHATEPGTESDEEPLLLNPCTDYPEQHLEFLLEGVVRAKLGPDKKPSIKGEISIDVYALNRTGLVHDRKEVMLQIQQRMYTVQRLASMLDEEISIEHKAVVEDLLSHELEALSRFCDSGRPFSMMARNVIEEFLLKITR